MLYLQQAIAWLVEWRVCASIRLRGVLEQARAQSGQRVLEARPGARSNECLSCGTQDPKIILQDEWLPEMLSS